MLKEGMYKISYLWKQNDTVTEPSVLFIQKVTSKSCQMDTLRICRLLSYTRRIPLNAWMWHSRKQAEQHKREISRYIATFSRTGENPGNIPVATETSLPSPFLTSLTYQTTHLTPQNITRILYLASHIIRLSRYLSQLPLKMVYSLTTRL